MGNQDFHGRTALVTAAGSGIGRATALMFARRGASLVISDIRGDAIRAVADEIEAAGAQVLAIAADMTDEPAVEAMVADGVARFGRIDCAFNNAGTNSRPTAITDITLEEWERLLSVNLTTTFLCMKHELRHMLRTGKGAIVNCASGAAHVPAPGMAHYTAAKHGVHGLTKCAAADYAAHNIRVNSICPGITDTALLSGFIAGDETIRKMLDDTCPRGKVGHPDEIAEAVLWMCSDAASYVSGLSMLVDGASVNR